PLPLLLENIPHVRDPYPQHAPDSYDEPKYIVFGKALDSLLMALMCRKCGESASTLTKSENGSSLTVIVKCPHGHSITKWSSQPRVKKIPVGNILISAAILF